jgi:UDP-N-acetylmuramyl pentapeptide phosphotransferase/UDP-N-acetylglucosamine-1-phosphate transferase
MDGIDGLAASETIAICMGIMLVTALTGSFGSQLSLSALIVLAAAAGFLWWNVHPARIFLGDVGSVPLGFLLGYLLLQMARAGYPHAALILPAYYLCDASITLARRAWRGEKIWQAHSEHFYQQAVRSGKRHDVVVRIINGVNILLIGLACLASLYPDSGWMYLAIAYGMVLAVLGFAFRIPRAERERMKEVKRA